MDSLILKEGGELILREGGQLIIKSESQFLSFETGVWLGVFFIGLLMMTRLLVKKKEDDG